MFQDNRKKELTKLMFDIMTGRSSLQKLGMENLVIFGQLVDGKLYEIEKMIEILSENNLNQMLQATNDVGVMSKERSRTKYSIF